MNACDDKPCCVALPGRGVVRVVGKDSFRFLQGLVTNDLAVLGEKGATIRACLLSPQGKYLHDFYVCREGEAGEGEAGEGEAGEGGGYRLYAEGGERAGDLARRLGMYRLRAEVRIECVPEVSVFLTWPDGKVSEEKPDLPEIPFQDWDMRRIRAGYADGSRDAEIGVSTLAELNLEGQTVSCTKGCYVGQEVVARMRSRNLGKRHLVPVLFSAALPPPGADIVLSGGDSLPGAMRSSCGDVGLVLMPREVEERLRAEGERGEENDPLRLLG